MRTNFLIGILGAGLGSRLQSSSKSKPLAAIAGTTLLGLLSRQFQKLGSGKVFCVLRDETLTAEEKTRLKKEFVGEIFFANTDSSLHTLGTLIEKLPASAGTVLFSMVDTIILPNDLEKFFQFCASLPPDTCGLLVTSFVDDEKPLWVSTDGSGKVTAFGQANSGLVTSGMYFLTEKAQQIALAELSKGTHKMRNFLGKLSESGIPIKTFVVQKTIDVDHPSDLEKAEQFLHGTKPE